MIGTARLCDCVLYLGYRTGLSQGLSRDGTGDAIYNRARVKV